MNVCAGEPLGMSGIDEEGVDDSPLALLYEELRKLSGTAGNRYPVIAT